MPQNILIIGGSYFLGRVTVERLAVHTDLRLWVVNRGNRPLAIKTVTEITCDRNDTGRLKALLPDLNWDAVIDFCGYTPKDIHNLLSCLSSQRIAHFIFISTASIYAPTRELPIRENAALLAGPQPQLGPAADYGFQKHLAETALVNFCGPRRIPYTLFRPTLIYGRYNYAPRESYFFSRMLQSQPLIIPDPDLALFQFVYVEDVARIIATAIGRTEVINRAFNLSAPELVGYGRLADILERVFGRRIERETLSAKEIDRQGLPLPFPFDSHLIFDGSAITRALDLSYTPLEQGLFETFEWYLENQREHHSGFK